MIIIQKKQSTFCGQFTVWPC